MATAHLIHGYLGSGKTTFSRRLEHQTSAIRFTHNEWMQRLYGKDPPEQQFAEYAKRVSFLMEELWVRCLRMNVDVILDFGFWSQAERDRIRSVITEFGADFRLYRLTCPDEIAWKRIQARNNAPDCSLYIAANTFSVLKARFEPLDEDEARMEVPQNF
ncbi:AAA family ATPase [Paramesorhizobium deserti]|uniref:AAA family ATPase n=1 Tax=Paramesorhizobium deserti TaxID=1494590 RepID=UPI0009E66A24|nr:AAA family ATPase [Paramesorhizobium deserti]